ncbi:Fructosamine kinase-domain-containing protein [Nemania abortiva]|nr:Fructosamine kinase-domain-containing protein [Nemania abortiva]
MPLDIHALLRNGTLQRPQEFNDIGGNFPIDQAILKFLPQGFKLISAETSDKTYTSLTGWLEGIEDDSPKKYFIKCAANEGGKEMLVGEDLSLTTIKEVCPDLVPFTWKLGEYESPPPDHSIHFLFEDFLTIAPNPPNPDRLADKLVKMHKDGKSPTGKFGFEIVTCDGPQPHPEGWEDDWATLFVKLLRSRVDMDAKANGPWEELERAAKVVIDQVVPTLLGSLKQDGEPIKPSLIHGDLWDGNMSVLKSGDPVFYDAGCYYAHNEMEIGMWRTIIGEHLRHPKYKEAYLKEYSPAEPAAEWDDRNRLYSLKYNLNFSISRSGIVRKIAYNDMCYLCEKYAPMEGIGKYDRELDPTKTHMESLQ